MSIQVLKPAEMPAAVRVKTSDPPDEVEVIELGIDADEEEYGVVEGRVFLWQRAAVVMLRTSDGVYAMGTYAPRPDQVWDRSLAKARARANALRYMPILREKLGLPRMGPAS